MLRAFQWDLARQVERLDWLLAQLPRYADWGYNQLYLHLEDAVEYPSLPGIARHDAYSQRDLHRLVNAASKTGIAVVPIVNLLGHTQYLVKVPALRDLNELRAADGSPLERGQICPVHPRTLEVADRLLRDVAPFCTAGMVHVGLDESFQLGRHPLSRQEIAAIGLAAHFGQYVGRLRELTRSLGLGMGMWADMLYFLPEAVSLLPREVAVYEWYYYAFRRRPKVELFNFRESDLGERLRARGNPYWGCPMNGAFRFEPLPHFADRLENILAWWRRCRTLNAAGMLVTSWEPYRLAQELPTVVDAAAASLWLDGVEEPRAMLERGFARVFGRASAKTAARVALAADKYPFSGYPRWEINARWDTVSRREPVAAYRREERHFERLRKTPGLPAPLRASLDLRWALAVRDVWVREAEKCGAGSSHPAGLSLPAMARLAEPTPAGKRTKAGGGPALHPNPNLLRAALRTGIRAARAMWARTRDPNVTSPNEQILATDLERVERLHAGEPVLGPQWQLCYRVHNVAPAAQLVGIQQLAPDGTWEMRQACHTIEFLSAAAQRRGTHVREHAAPVAWDGNISRTPKLRMVLRGLGQVVISDVALTDGVTSFAATRRRLRLGAATPKAGWPDLDWSADRAVADIRFKRT